MTTPTVMPILSRGAHRRPRDGACFMELASYLAGEKWSDHPRCTDPSLAVMAREVNDRVGDDHRQRLAPLVPEVVGLTTTDARLCARVARAAALAALPLGRDDRQRLAALGLVECERALNRLDGAPADRLSPRSVDLLRRHPEAHRWATEFAGRLGHHRPRSFAKRAAPAIVRSSVATIADSPVRDGGTDHDDVLVRLLAESIGIARELVRGRRSSPDDRFVGGPRPA